MIDGKRKGYNWHEYVGKFRTISSPINALLETVWSFSMDLKIPEFPPRVCKVDLIDGKASREPGVSH